MADQSHYPAADENVVLGPEATPIISRDTFLPSGPKSAASAVSSSKGASSAAGGEGAAMQGRGEHLHVPTIIAPQAAGEGFQDSGAATPLSLAESGRAGSFATAKDVDEVETPMAVEDGPEVAGGLTAGGEVGERGVLKDAERKSLLSVAGGGAEIERTRSSTSIQSDGPFLARTPTQNSAQHNPLTSVVSKQSSTYKTAISQHPAPAPTINLPANTSPQAQPLTKPRRPSIVFGFPANDEPGKEKAQITSSLKTWWKGFSGGGAGKPGQGPGQARGKGKEREKGLEVPKGVFGVLLEKSLQYASVQISTTKADGGLYVWGYVPVVVAKCGLHLKDTATEVPGTFRVSGSAKRMKELQAMFDNPPKYGKNLDWKKTTYTTHDVATIVRRYLTQMPEPIIPYELYHDFRENLNITETALAEAIKRYQRLIAKMPKPNQYLLLYVLDLLSVFARKADKNLMTAPNLAMIFQPGIIAHKIHEMAPSEHVISQKVLEFLIEHQDHFLLGMQLESEGSQGSDAAPSSLPPPSAIGSGASPASPTMSQSASPISPTAPSFASHQPPVQVLATSPPASEGLVPIPSKTSSHKPSIASPKPVSPALPPPPPAPKVPELVRADTDLMVPSDSDDEAPVGGYYVKTEDPSRLTAISNSAAARSRTTLDKRTSRGTPTQEVAKVSSSSSGAGGLRSRISLRRGNRPRTVSQSQTDKPPGIIIVDNPPMAGATGGGGLFRRRTAPSKRNKDDDAIYRKKAEQAVAALGTGKKAPVEV